MQAALAASVRVVVLAIAAVAVVVDLAVLRKVPPFRLQKLHRKPPQLSNNNF